MWEEAERLPRWKHTINYGLKDSAKKLERKTKELELADIVIVPSTFVYNSLPSWALNKRIVVAPFGTPHTTKEIPLKKQNSAKRLRVLFAGSMSQRKGLADLFEAVKLLNTASVELVVLGSLMTTGMMSGYYAVAIWVPTYLKTVRNLSVLNTGGYTFMIILGSFVGYLVAAYLADRLGRRRTFFVFAFGTAAVTILYTLVPISDEAMLLLGFPLGFFLSGITRFIPRIFIGILDHA